MENNFTPILEAVLSQERTVTERIQSLRELQQFLYEEEVIQKLSELVYHEQSVQMREVLLSIIAEIDITKISNRKPYLECLGYFSAIETETELRKIALQKLISLSTYDNAIQILLAEILINDFDENIQQLCLKGIFSFVQKQKEVVEILQRYVQSAPKELRRSIFTIATQLERNDAEKIILALLQPWEEYAIRENALIFIQKLPSLSSSTIQNLLQHFRNEPDAALKEKIITIINQLQYVDAEIYQIIFNAIEQTPELHAMLEVFVHRMANQPEHIPQLTQLYSKATSVQLKWKILSLFENIPLTALYITALSDYNVWLRFKAVELCLLHFLKDPKIIWNALIEAATKEQHAFLKTHILKKFLETGRKPVEIEKVLLQWCETEKDPFVQQMLSLVILDIPITEENKNVLLKFYQQVVREPHFSPKVRNAVIERLQSFAYSNDKDLKESLLTLLHYADTIEMVETVFERLQTQQFDIQSIVPDLLTVFYKHIAHYPRDPLHSWARMFYNASLNMEEVRSQLPYIIELTGEVWMLDRVEANTQKNNFLPAFKTALQSRAGNASIEIFHLLKDAWENRTIRKNDIISALQFAIVVPNQEGTVQQIFQMLEEAKLVTSELMDFCLHVVKGNYDNSICYTIEKYLEKVCYTNEEFRKKLLQNFTQQEYTLFQKNSIPKEMERIPKTLRDWQSSSSYSRYDSWKIADVYFALSPHEDIFTLLTTMPDKNISGELTIHYLILQHLWRNPREWGQYFLKEDNREKFFRAIFHLMKSVEGNQKSLSLYERAVWIFKQRWDEYSRSKKNTPLPADLLQAVAEVYIALCKKQEQLEPQSNTFPDFLKGMDIATLEKLWFWKDEEKKWETFIDTYSVEKMYEEATDDLRSGNKENAYRLLKELLARYGHTKFVQKEKSRIERVLAG